MKPALVHTMSKENYVLEVLLHNQFLIMKVQGKRDSKIFQSAFSPKTIPEGLKSSHNTLKDMFYLFQESEDVTVDEAKGIVMLKIRTIVKNHVREHQVRFQLEKKKNENEINEQKGLADEVQRLREQVIFLKEKIKLLFPKDECSLNFLRQLIKQEVKELLAVSFKGLTEGIGDMGNKLSQIEKEQNKGRLLQKRVKKIQKIIEKDEGKKEKEKQQELKGKSKGSKNKTKQKDIKDIMEDFKKEIKMFKKEFEEKREKIKQIKAIKDGMREYRGQMKDGKREGMGITKIIDGKHKGDRYQGEHRNGCIEGRGIYYWSDGRRYEGEWKNGQKEGKGISYCNDGSRYEGEWKGNRGEGRGIFYNNDGSKYEGEYRNNKFEGKGTFSWVNGNYEIGEYYDNKIHGKALYYYKDGRVEERIYCNGKIMQK